MPKPKGPPLPSEVRALIVHVYEEHPKWKAPRILKSVRAHLREEKRRGGLSDIPAELLSTWPSIHVVRKVLGEARKPRPATEEDKPWSIFDHPVAPDALPRVLQEYHSIDERTCFTVRHAKWIARLSAVELPERFRSPETFPIFYCLVAGIERLFESVDRPADFDLVERMLAAAHARAQAEREGRMDDASRCRQVEEQTLARCLSWFGGEFVNLWLKEREKPQRRKRKKVNNDQT